MISPNDEYINKSKNAYEEIKSRHAKIIYITNDNNHRINDNDNIIVLPYNKSYHEILSIIPLQLIAYYTSLKNDINPDMPKNLAKVVTVE